VEGDGLVGGGEVDLEVGDGVVAGAEAEVGDELAVAEEQAGAADLAQLPGLALAEAEADERAAAVVVGVDLPRTAIRSQLFGVSLSLR
jgi:hypothetical protein